MNKLESLELDIDCRISKLWSELNENQELNLTLVAAFMRAAYGQGYQDALGEPVRGQLCEDHGYAIPERKCA